MPHTALKAWVCSPPTVLVEKLTPQKRIRASTRMAVLKSNQVYWLSCAAVRETAVSKCWGRKEESREKWVHGSSLIVGKPHKGVCLHTEMS